MAFNFTKLVVSIVVFTNLHLMGIHGGAYIDIQPEEFSLTKPEDVHISCRPGGLGNEAHEIVLMQIARKGDSPMAQIHQNFKFSYAQQQNSSKPLYEVKGHIDKDVGQSYLNLTLLKTKKDWFGQYTCRVYYLDGAGTLKQDTVDGNITETKTNFEKVESIIGTLMKKISFLEDKANFLENKTTFLENKSTFLEKKTTFLENKSTFLESKTTFLENKTTLLEIKESSLQDKTASLQKIAASLQNETNFLKRKATSLFNKTSFLEGKAKSLEDEISSTKHASNTIVNRVTILEKKNEDQSKEMQSLAKKDAMLDSKLDQTAKQLKVQMDQFANKLSVSSITNRVSVLEQITKKERTDITADKASLSSLTERVKLLEQNERDDSIQIKSLADKESVTETNLAKTNHVLSQEVKDRLADKASATSVLKNVDSLERESGNQLNKIKSLTSQQSAIKSDLLTTNKKLSQEVSDRVHDKAAAISISKRISILEKKDGDKTKQIQSLKNTDSSLGSKLTSIENTNTKQSQEIKTISDNIRNSLSRPASHRANHNYHGTIGH